MMRTISGKEVSMVSIKSIPYLKDINTTVGSSSNYYSSGITTETVDVGLDLSITPYFDVNSSMVSVDLDLDLSSLLSMDEITSGDRTIIQPQTQKQTFTNTMKLKAGESSVIGGVMYDTATDDRTGVSYLDDYKIAGQKKSNTKNAVFIILRPTVSVFGDFKKEKEVIQSLDGE